jgi:hypothetical protein
VVGLMLLGLMRWLRLLDQGLAGSCDGMTDTFVVANPRVTV